MVGTLEDAMTNSPNREQIASAIVKSGETTQYSMNGWQH